MESLQTDYSTYIHKSRYARWLDDEKRRETWEETVNRYVNFIYSSVKEKKSISKKDLRELHELLGASCEL